MEFDIKGFDSRLLAVAHNALEDVLENVHDVNTSPAAKRSITINVVVVPKDHRSRIDATIGYTVKRAPREALELSLLTGVDYMTGEIEVAEYRGQMLGQVELKEVPEADPGTGEVLEGVIDLRKMQNGGKRDHGHPDLKIT